jgi:predicted nucleotidyltransferase/HEPN domain-containing protein
MTATSLGEALCSGGSRGADALERVVRRTVEALSHPDLADPSILVRIAERLEEHLGAEHVIVYGSVARGEATRHSDIDLFVIAPSTDEGYRRMTKARELIRDLSSGLPISPLVLTPDEVRRRLAGRDPFVREILETGVVVGRARAGPGGPIDLYQSPAREGEEDDVMQPGEQIPEGWRRIARQDWQRLHLLLNAGDGAGAGLFLRQALEKLLKGYLIGRGWQLQKTHELDRLLDAAGTYDPSLLAFRPLCARVSTYYLVERYPTAAAGGGPSEAQIRLDLDEARRLVRALFPDELLR